jgi:hypothetical protein
MACPFGAIEVGVEGETGFCGRKNQASAKKCDLCQEWRAVNNKDVCACVEACPKNALEIVDISLTLCRDRRKMSAIQLFRCARPDGCRQRPNAAGQDLGRATRGISRARLSGRAGRTDRTRPASIDAYSRHCGKVRVGMVVHHSRQNHQEVFMELCMTIYRPLLRPRPASVSFSTAQKVRGKPRHYKTKYLEWWRKATPAPAA